MRVLWVLLGIAAFLLGVIGVFLPILPTTPFILLAAFAFGKGSDRLRALLENSALFGPIILDWEAHGVIEQRFKNIAYIFMALAFTASIVAGLNLKIIVVQGICLGCAVLFIATRPTHPHDDDLI